MLKYLELLNVKPGKNKLLCFVVKVGFLNPNSIMEKIY